MGRTEYDLVPPPGQRQNPDVHSLGRWILFQPHKIEEDTKRLQASYPPEAKEHDNILPFFGHRFIG